MIYFVRHGASDWNENLNINGEKAPKFQSHADFKTIDKVKENDGLSI